MVIPLAVGACHLEFRVCIEVNVRRRREIFEVLENFAPKALEIFQVLEDFAPKAREMLGFSACHLGVPVCHLGVAACHLGADYVTWGYPTSDPK